MSSSISIQFQLDDTKPILANLPAHFTLDDFQRVAGNVLEFPVYSYDFICQGQELDLHDENKFNHLKRLICSGVTIFTELRTKCLCFLADTLVRRADLTDVAISDVHPGDVLLACTNFGEIVTTTVEKLFVHDVDEYMEIRAGETQLRVTREHPFFIGNGSFCPVNKLRVNDCIYGLRDGSLQSTPILNIQTILAPATRVYNLHVTKPNTYFANGFAVHNKLGHTFVDLSVANAVKRIEWNSEAPKWRIARPGICLEGTCTNESCEARQQIVIINIGIKQFNVLLDDAALSQCPQCSEYVQPLTCAFNRCSWRWWGMTQAKNGLPPKRIAGDWKKADNAYHRFDPDESGTVTWRELIIEAKAQ